MSALLFNSPCRVALVTAVAVLLGPAAPFALADDAPPPSPTPAEPIARGEAIAKARCGVCHAVGAKDESPTWVNSNTPFRRLSERFPIPMLQQAAKSGAISGHDEMPGFQFSLDEITALLSYIDSLSPAPARYLGPSSP